MTKFLDILEADKKPKGMESKIANNVPRKAISKVSSIDDSKILKFEKSGGIILLIMSDNTKKEFSNNEKGLIFKSMLTKIVSIIKLDNMK